MTIKLFVYLTVFPFELHIRFSEEFCVCIFLWLLVFVQGPESSPWSLLMIFNPLTLLLLYILISQCSLYSSGFRSDHVKCIFDFAFGCMIQLYTVQLIKGLRGTKQQLNAQNIKPLSTLYCLYCSDVRGSIHHKVTRATVKIHCYKLEPFGSVASFYCKLCEWPL